MTEQTIPTAFGRFVLDSEADAKMASRLARPEYPQQDVIDLARALKAEKVVDIGAHVGTVSVPLALQGMKVVAFEPNMESFTFLQKNCEGNTVHIDARNKGLADKSGRASVAVLQTSNAGAHTLGEGNDVEVSMLDTEVSSTDFIKIDVEGMELSVLRGGSKLIERSSPAVFFEVNLSALRAHGTTLASLTAFFKQAGYQLYVLDSYRLYRVPSLTFAALFIAPRSLLFKSSSAPFDILAMSARATLPYPAHSPLRSSVYLLMRYIKAQYGRLFR
ncbi:MAG: FkbM family methyltransferase [Candidatus Pacebacteria bacterium]|nr:FkbM family methyltransferase [Candidatus Paceibacterota bacterium]